MMRRPIAPLVLAGLLLGCAEETPRTVRLVISTDIDVPGQLDEINVQVAASRTAEAHICVPSERGFRLSVPGALPIQVAVEIGSQYTSWVWAKVEGYSGGVPVVRREIVRAWPAEGVVDVDVRLEASCLGSACGNADQCIAGVCRPLQYPGLLDDPARIDEAQPCGAGAL